MNQISSSSPTSEASRGAEYAKQRGNALFNAQNYPIAAATYSLAINLNPNVAVYYSNRAACFIKLNEFRMALDDCRECIRLDPNFIKGYLRLTQCYLSLNHLQMAMDTIQTIKEIDPDNTEVENYVESIVTLRKLETEMTRTYQNKDYDVLLTTINKCLKIVPECMAYKLKKAEYLALLGSYDESEEIADEMLEDDDENADAFYIKGLCCYYQDDLVKALRYLKQVLEIAPTHIKAGDLCESVKLIIKKKDEGLRAFNYNNYWEAYNCYSEALKIDPSNKKVNSKLYFDRAMASYKIAINENLNNEREFICKTMEDCSEALLLDNTNLDALLQRAKCYMDIGEYFEAFSDYETAYKMERTDEIKELMEEAEDCKLEKEKRDKEEMLLRTNGNNGTMCEDYVRNLNYDDINSRYEDNIDNTYDISDNNNINSNNDDHDSSNCCANSWLRIFGCKKI